MDFLVTVEHGQVRGKTAIDIRGGLYYSFQGIPYAKPPIGDLRFKAPQPLEPWSGIKNATQEGSECFAHHMIFQHIVGSEDCLCLNVYTRELPRGNNNVLNPVMVYIHGGGFNSGSNKTDVYGPDFLITEDVVLVVINYRLGILGFLSFEDPSLGVPGNAGLKDMVLSLKWVQNNITQFCGDPSNVTIFGESAGAAAVHYLILSPLTHGLFSRAIIQSGCAVNVWAQGKRNLFDITTILGFQSKSEKECLQFLRSLPVEKILEAQDKLKDPLAVDELRPYGPIVEKISNEPAFLTINPIDAIISGNYNKVPIMIGYTSREGMLFQVIARSSPIQFVKDFEKAIPFHLNLGKGTNISKQVAKKIKDFYYGTEEPSMENIDKFFMLQSDNFFIRDIHNAIKSHLKTSPTPIYLYRFSVEAGLNVYKHFANITAPGACHADDLGYLFKTMVTPFIKPGSVEDITVQRMVKLWTNFARNGDPNPIKKDPLIDITWKPVSEGQHHYLEIGRALTVGINPESERMQFWDEIYKVHPTISKL